MTACGAMARLMGARDGVDYHTRLDAARHTMKSIGMTDSDIESDFPTENFEEILHCMIHTPEKFDKDCRDAMAQLFSRN